MRVLIQLRPPIEVVDAVVMAAGGPGAGQAPAPGDLAPDLPGVSLDATFAPVPVPRPLALDGSHPVSLNQPTVFSLEPSQAGVLVRGEIADDELTSRLSLLLTSRPDVAGIFADPTIETCVTCGSTPPVGDWKNVAEELRAGTLAEAGYTGAGTAVAIVDTGVNLGHLEQQLGHAPTLDAGRSWTPAGVTTQPGAHPVAHGTMCAFDALIAAPQATLLDVAVLLSKQQGETALAGLLSDAVAAYAYLRTVLDAMPAEHRALVISNSWGSFSPKWDFPPGHPGNYSDNRAHPFNIIVGSLEQAGADILFAAGNCGRDCPDGRCEFPSPSLPIGGANSHPQVLSLGGVDVTGERVGYSSQGPGRLTDRKPDVCSYTHFDGSKAFGGGLPDSGTSAACPVAAGVVAAIRTVVPPNQVTPDQLRTILCRTAVDKSTVGYDYDYGYGVLDVAGVLGSLEGRQKQ